MTLVTGSGDRHTRPGVKLTYDDFVLFPDDTNDSGSPSTGSSIQISTWSLSTD
jgi:hypothetical protein